MSLGLKEITDDSLSDIVDIDDDISEYVSLSRPSLFEVDTISESEIIGDSNLSSQNRFFAESPYYNAFIEKELYYAGLSKEVFADIVQKSADLAEVGSLMATAIRRLSLSCQLGSLSETYPEKEKKIQQEAIGPEMTLILNQLGDALSSIAFAQEKVSNMIATAVGPELKAMVENQIKMIDKLKEKEENQTKLAEQSFRSYLNGKEVGSNFSSLSASFSDLGFFPSGGINNSAHSSKSIKLSLPFSKKWAQRESIGERAEEDPRATNFKGDDKEEDCLDDISLKSEDPKLLKAIKLAKNKCSMERVCVEEVDAELKRYQLGKFLVNARRQRTFALSESAGSLFHQIKKFHEVCQEMLIELVPEIAQNKERFEKKRRDHETSEGPVWDERETLITQTLDKRKEAEVRAIDDLNRIMKSDSKSIEMESLDLEGVEQKVKFWELPKKLAHKSRFSRLNPPGVLTEGYLYEKGTSMIKRQSTWNRNWFMLKSDAIYSLRYSPELKKATKYHSIAKIKVCDVVLCTVKELPDEPPARFLFQLIMPNRRPKTLQARGPMEIDKWVKGIRMAIAEQLAKGDPNSTELDSNIGRKHQHRCSEIINTVYDRHSNIFNIDDESHEQSHSAYLLEGLNKDVDEKSLIENIMDQNPTCADCGIACPDWASLNLGILVCLECSGVHRALGVHVSKVRSLTLDSLSHGEASLLLALGNKRVNRIWENDIDSRRAFQKPHGTTDRNLREKWIKSKYVEKEFLPKNEFDSNATSTKMSRELYLGVKRGDLICVAKALAYGAKMDWKNSEEGDRTAMQVAVARLTSNEDSALECYELMLQNGAKFDSEYKNKENAHVSLLQRGSKLLDENNVFDVSMTKMEEEGYVSDASFEIEQI